MSERTVSPCLFLSTARNQKFCPRHKNHFLSLIFTHHSFRVFPYVRSGGDEGGGHNYTNKLNAMIMGLHHPRLLPLPPQGAQSVVHVITLNRTSLVTHLHEEKVINICQTEKSRRVCFCLQHKSKSFAQGIKILFCFACRVSDPDPHGSA